MKTQVAGFIGESILNARLHQEYLKAITLCAHRFLYSLHVRSGTVAPWHDRPMFYKTLESMLGNWLGYQRGRIREELYFRIEGFSAEVFNAAYAIVTAGICDYYKRHRDLEPPIFASLPQGRAKKLWQLELIGEERVTFHQVREVPLSWVAEHAPHLVWEERIVRGYHRAVPVVFDFSLLARMEVPEVRGREVISNVEALRGDELIASSVRSRIISRHPAFRSYPLLYRHMHGAFPAAVVLYHVPTGLLFATLPTDP